MGRWASEEPWPARGSLGRWSSWPAALLAASILSSCFLLTQAVDIPVKLDPQWPLRGQTVTLIPEGEHKYVVCTWFREEQTESKRIFTYVPSLSEQQNGPNFTARESAGPNCSLAISRLTLNDTGIYIVSKIVSGGSEVGRAHVQVSECLPKPSVSAFPSPYPAESTDITLTCNTISKEATVSWFYNENPLESHPRIEVSDDNRIVTINSINRNDTGEYQCNVSNPVSSNISNPLHVAVIYGPETAEIQQTEPSYNQHTNIILSCYADAFPDPHYTWLFNGKERGTQSELLIPDASPEDSGDYVCRASNVLSHQESCATVEIEVVAAVSNVTIKGPSTTVEYQTVQLTCTSLGSNVSYHWLKENQLVEPGDRVSLSDKNKTLTFTPSTRNDTANYICQGVNDFSSQSSEPYWLNIFYGPDSPIIEPQETIYNEGFTLNLSCFADSNPPANYSWWLSDELLEDQKGSQLLIPDLSESSAGNYTCSATNNYTASSNTSSILIDILAAVSNVNISGPFTAVEHHTVQLDCTSLGGNVSYFWFKDNQLVEAGDHVVLSDKNETLTFTPINRNGTANYVCQGVNRFSSQSSEAHWLEVFYGPDRPVIEPQESVHSEGSNLSLSCFADSNPSANYSWWFNDELLEDQYSSQLLVLDLLESNAGNYTCNATNDRTGHTNTSSLEISILAAVSNVTITGPSTPIEYHTVQLNCTSLGSHVFYYWLKENQLVEPGDRVFLSDQNKTLTFTPSTRNDTANYICQGVNDFSSQSSEPYWLDIFYGPDQPVIEPQESVYNEGSDLSLSCFADSNPSANYSWWFNDELLEDQYSSQLLVLDLLESNAGNYTCSATNNRTGYSNTSSLEISILAAVSNVTITGPSTPVEYHAVQLNCTSLGSHVSYYWFKDNQLVEPGDRVFLSDKNETLTFIPSNRNDTANYVCRGVNDFSSQSSAPYWLNIFYGPDSPLIEPQESVYYEHSSLSLSCLADSNPPANYSWWFNDQQQEDQNGSLFLIPELLKSNAGNYTCNAINDYTTYSNTSFLEISILAAVSNVTITGPSTPVEYHTVQLNCTSLGGHVSYYWFKGDQLVEAGDRVILSDKNETLTFTSSNRNDTGNYICRGVNNFSSQSSEPYWLDILYGPDSPIIEPQETIYNEGSTLNLSCFADSNPPANYSWWLSDELLEDQKGSQLLIPDLLESSAGNYTCSATNDYTASSNTSSILIDILAAVSNVTITGPSTPVEYHTVQLHCTSLGSHVFYYWLKENQLVEPGDRVFLSDQNKTLMFTPGTRNDTANYVCQGVNDFSSQSSEPYWLNILYGPDRPVIEPQESVYNEGSDLSLSCFADSNPSANYSWWFNDELLEDQYGSQLLVLDLLESNAGNYTCSATNNRTGYSNTSSLEISILAAVSNVTITGPSASVEYHPVQLTCTSLGSHVFYYWLKENQLVEPGDRVFLSDQNKTLTFIPSTRNDTANYICQGVNDFSSQSSEPYWLDIFYGPDSPLIEPQESVYNEGSDLSLSCFADSNPSANYSWWFNDELLEDQYGSQLLILDLLKSSAGNYTCNATNVYTAYSNFSSLAIHILERVSNVTITSHPAKAIENELTTLTCSSVGTNVSYVWSKGSQTLESAGHISVNYSSLTFNPTRRNDTGSYTCYGHNSFSSSSATYPLEVFYGPAVPIISPQQYDYAEGSTFTLHCHADSLPSPQYTWYFNESEFPEKSPQLSIPSLSFDMAGNYTCSAFNSETNLSSSSSLKIRVLEKVFNVSIQGPSETTENDSVNLTCSSQGSEVSYTWFKENQTLEDGGHILLWGPNHEKLTLNPVQRSDAGSYTCRGNNSISEDTSNPFPLDVFYGPDDPIITPQEHNYLKGEDLNLHCQADSNPVAQYTWFFNEMEEIRNGSQLLLPDLSFNNSGSYTCNATNIKTDISRATVWEIQVLEKLFPPNLWPKELSVNEHANVTLNCTTSEHSSVTVSWFKDGKPIPDKAVLSKRNRTLTIPDISKADAGTYTCEAKNNANNATSNPSKISVNDGPAPPFLTPGQIVGIVIGCLAGVLLIVVVLYFAFKNTTLGRMAQPSSNGNIPSAPGHNQGVTDTKPTVGEEDIQYTTLAFSGNSPSQPGPKPTVPPDSGTIYSVIKNK